MRTIRCTVWATTFCAAFVACDVYQDHFKGDFNAGSADPANYPPPYRGAGNTRNIAGSGNGITEVRAFVGGNGIGYFLFPYGTSQVVTPGYSYTAAQISGQRGAALNISQASRPLPLTYVFDPPGTDTAFPASPQCQAPAGYQYDRRRDDVHYDDQGNIFTVLPNATFNQGSLPTWTYVPIVQEVPVTSAGEPCQEIKSEKTLLSRGDVSVPKTDDGSKGVPDGRYLAWALFDPGSAVYRVGQTAATSQGVAIQRWGWYQQFLVAYLDGGYIPLASATQFKTQRLFIPRANVVLNCTTNADCFPFAGTAPGNSACETATGRCRTSTRCTANSQCAGAGATCDTATGFCRQPTAGIPASSALGYDVLEATPGAATYSPICEVMTYKSPSDPVQVTNLPRDAATILGDLTAYGPLQAPASPPAGSIVSGTTVPPFVFCLQIPPQPGE